MGGPLLVTLADIHIIKMETDVVVPTKTIIYKQHVTKIYNPDVTITIDKLCDD